MTNFFVKCFFCVSIIMSLAGCATYQVSKMGKYTSSQVPERAVIFPDGRVVVDFSERRIAERVFGSGYYNDKLYYKRLYFEPGRFLDPRELSRDPTSRNVGSRLSQYLNSANADVEEGSWKPLASDDLPPIPQSEPVLTDFSSYCRRPFPVLNKQQLQFETCDTRTGMAQYSQVKARVDYNRREWWSYPAQLLYIPAVAIDIVTAPIQLIALGVVLNDYGHSQR